MSSRTGSLIAIVAFVLVSVACGDGDETERRVAASAAASPPPGAAWAELGVEQVDPRDGELEGAIQMIEVDWEPVAEQDLASSSVVVIRGVPGAPEPLSTPSENDTIADRLIATYTQPIAISEVLAVAGQQLSRAQSQALAAGQVDRVFTGPDGSNPAVREAFSGNSVIPPPSGTGVLPVGAEMVVFLEPDSSSERPQSRYFHDTGYVEGYFYIDGSTLKRPTHPLVDPLPNLPLSYENQATLRGAGLVVFSELGMHDQLALSDLAPSFARIGDDLALESP